MKKLLIIIAAILMCLTVNTFAQYKIGVLAKRGAPAAMKQWGATAAYLSAQTGEKFKIIPLKFTAIEPMVKSGRIDFMLANSAFFVEMEQKYKVKAIATMINSKNG